MVLGSYRQTFVGGVHGRTFRHGPGYQNSIDRQTEIIVQVTGSVFLNDKDLPRVASARSACRLRRFSKLSLVAIIFERHRDRASTFTPRPSRPIHSDCGVEVLEFDTG